MDNQVKTEEIEHSDEIFYPSFLFKEIFVMIRKQGISTPL